MGFGKVQLVVDFHVVVVTGDLDSSCWLPMKFLDKEL